MIDEDLVSGDKPFIWNTLQFGTMVCSVGNYATVQIGFCSPLYYSSYVGFTVRGYLVVTNDNNIITGGMVSQFRLNKDNLTGQFQVYSPSNWSSYISTSNWNPTAVTYLYY